MIPSLLQIPSAVSDSKLHSVLPNNGKGDFQFDRSTGATRINKDGLIEEVGYFSSELVQNGNFSELGSELVTNGDFSNGLTNWTLLGTHNSDNYAIVENDKLILRNDGTGSGVYQTVLTTGKTYKITLDVSEIVGNGFKIDGLGVIVVNTVGTKTFYAKATESNFYLYRNSVSPQAINGATIDNVSVKQVDPNDRWTLGTGWSYGENKAIKDTSAGTGVYCQQDFSTLVNGSLYKIQFDLNITSATTTTIGISNSGAFGNLTAAQRFYTTSGTKKIVGTYDSSYPTFIRFVGGANTSYEITNISIVEVQGDRPRLSYDITNGVVEDKPHLLLEPSATNLITFSEDFSQSVWSVNQTTKVANAGVCPDGTNNAFNLIANATSGVHLLAISGTGTNQRTMSIFAKQNGYTRFRFNTGSSGLGFASFNLANGTVAATGGTFFNNAKIESLPNDWYRCSMTMNSGGSTTVTIAMEDDAGNVTFTGDATNGILLWGGMLEEQSYATSYIKTAGTTITRAAETCNNSKPSVNSTEGVLYAEIQALASDSTDKVITMSDGSTSNRVQVYFNSSNQIVGGLISSGSGQAAITYSTDIKLVSKIAFKFKQNDFALWVNGSEVGTDVVGNPATGLNVIDFDNGAGGANFYGKLKGLAVYNEALSESQLMQLTGVTASSIYNNFVTRTASFTVEALNEVKKVIDNL